MRPGGHGGCAEVEAETGGRGESPGREGLRGVQERRIVDTLRGFGVLVIRSRLNDSVHSFTIPTFSRWQSHVVRTDTVMLSGCRLTTCTAFPVAYSYPICILSGGGRYPHEHADCHVAPESDGDETVSLHHVYARHSSLTNAAQHGLAPEHIDSVHDQHRYRVRFL